MKFVCIVAEYNPLHLGHVYHLDASRSLGDATMVILGGDFCQRGFSMVMDKYTRAVEAVKAGADVVVELPTLHAVHCAEQFAVGAMRIADLLPDSVLSFGSESGDVDALRATSALLSAPSVNERIRALVAQGVAHPKARADALAAYASDHNISVVDLTLPNNILALEYIRAARQPHLFHTVKRIDNYHSTAPCWSSSYIRQALKDGAAIDHLVPPYVAADLRGATSPADVLYLAALRAQPKAYYEGLLDNAEGLSNRIWQCAQDANTLAEAIDAAMTRRYTRARIARLFTAALLDLKQADFDLAVSQPAYFNVLAIKHDKTQLLSELSRYGTVYTSEADLLSGGIAASIDARAHQTYRLLHSIDVAHSVRIVD